MLSREEANKNIAKMFAAMGNSRYKCFERRFFLKTPGSPRGHALNQTRTLLALAQLAPPVLNIAIVLVGRPFLAFKPPPPKRRLKK